MRGVVSADWQLQNASLDAGRIAGATRLIRPMSAASVRPSCAQLSARALAPATAADHLRRGRLLHTLARRAIGAIGASPER